MSLSLDLLRKYNVQGPRYTSYPPAPSWNENVGAADYEQAIEGGNASKTVVPLSLYAHLPFCEKLCYFCGCTTVITGKNRSFEPPYVEAVLQEIDWLGARIDRKRPVVQFHLGGGTPTYLEPQTLTRLLERFHRYFRFDPKAEVSVEVDPRVTTIGHLEALRKQGFNRISMGVQDFQEKVQKAINRVQSFEQTRELVGAARALGYQSVNMDLIYGLPHQTPASFEQTIEKVLSISPDRLAVYSYAHVPWLKKHQELLKPSLPGEADKFSIFLTAQREFKKAGFEYIGMDHFAKPTDELSEARKKRTLWRNFQGYTTKAGTDLFGVGMSAISSVQQGFFQNQKTLETYQTAIQEKGCATHRGFRMGLDDKIRARVIQNLLCHADVVKAEIEATFGLVFDDYFEASLAALAPLEADGLLELLPDRIRPTELGRIFLRNIAMAFDVYLPKEGQKKVFSRTV